MEARSGMNFFVPDSEIPNLILRKWMKEHVGGSVKEYAVLKAVVSKRRKSQVGRMTVLVARCTVGGLNLCQ